MPRVLCKAGLSYRRARKLTGKRAAVIRDERVKVSRVRHDREAATGKHKRKDGPRRWMRRSLGLYA
jgi:hypothetical protein